MSFIVGVTLSFGHPAQAHTITAEHGAQKHNAGGFHLRQQLRNWVQSAGRLMFYCMLLCSDYGICIATFFRKKKTKQKPGVYFLYREYAVRFSELGRAPYFCMPSKLEALVRSYYLCRRNKK